MESKRTDQIHLSSKDLRGYSICIPLLTSMSVSVCHLFIATNHESSFRRQLRSMTNFALSSPKAWNTPWRRSMEKLPFGNRYDVMIIYWKLLA